MAHLERIEIKIFVHLFNPLRETRTTIRERYSSS
ncbi:hypothetical protein T01_14805 [Trichinella spiralis]|uniref:Uncharacterized protein n=1 Tax=Trichinella spiralis TaxID=6334 RepID=A0A0V1AJG6_TRISP|nr:hypothetical protein T01_14805 [Trichinella spiralis]